MSDRYETPRWNDELDEPDEPEGADPSPAARRPPTPTSRLGRRDADLDASSENVLDGWPATTTAALDEEVAFDAASAQPLTRSRISFRPRKAPTRSRLRTTRRPRLGDDGPRSGRSHGAAGLLRPRRRGRRRAPSRRHRGRPLQRRRHDTLLESALAELDACGVSRDAVTVMPVPGAFELPLAAMALAKTRRFACIVALGCVIRGDTPHFDYVVVRGSERAAARRDRDRRPGRLRRAHARPRRPGREPLREGRRVGAHGARDGRSVREPAGRRSRLSGRRHRRTARGGFRYHPKPHVQDLLTLREEARLRQQPKPLDGRHEAAVQPEPPAGPDDARRQGDARLRLHALPQGRQGH